MKIDFVTTIGNRDEALGLVLRSPLTNRQRECLARIYRFVRANSMYPTQRQLAEEMACSQASVAQMLASIEKKGYLTKDRQESNRNMRLTTLARELFEGKQEALDLDL